MGIETMKVVTSLTTSLANPCIIGLRRMNAGNAEYPSN